METMERHTQRWRLHSIDTQEEEKVFAQSFSLKFYWHSTGIERGRAGDENISIMGE